jgi:hypothetical protein
VPVRDSGTSSNSSPAQAGLRQNAVSRGKNTVPQARHRVPRRAGASPPVNQPSTAGVGLAVTLASCL